MRRKRITVGRWRLAQVRAANTEPAKNGRPGFLREWWTGDAMDDPALAVTVWACDGGYEARINRCEVKQTCGVRFRVHEAKPERIGTGPTVREAVMAAAMAEPILIEPKILTPEVVDALMQATPRLLEEAGISGSTDCPICDGSGEDEDGKHEPCANCGGTGRATP